MANERRRFTDAAILSLVLALAYLLKRHYSSATPERLSWILAPTTRIVETVMGVRFTFEPHVGYVSRELATLVAPACAGVNFLVVCLCSLSFGFISCFDRTWKKVAWVLTASATAFAATVFANALRITAGMLLHTSRVGTRAFSAVAIHRIEGTLVYVTCLLVVYFLVERHVRAPS